MFFSFLACFAFSYKGAVLVIMDGFGESAWPEGNGIEMGRTPTLDSMKQRFPYISLIAAQQPVGLIRGQPGSSAVGHQTLGLGRITPSYYQQLERSLNPDSPNALHKNKVLRKALYKTKRLHIEGLCTDEGNFAHPKFLPPLFRAALEENVSNVYIHCIISSLAKRPSQYVKDVESLIPPSLNARVASVHSGFTGLDKFGNWDRTAISVNALFGYSKSRTLPRKEALKYLDNVTKGQIVTTHNPIFFDESEDSIMKDGDVVIMTHYREEQSLQITDATAHGIPGLVQPKKIKVYPFIYYGKSVQDLTPLLPPIKYNNSLGAWISKKGFKQLRVSESYKHAHVTTFFSGGIMEPIYPGEVRVENITSLHESMLEEHPEMNASLVCDYVLRGMKSQEYKLIVVNFANVDATGHIGSPTAVKKAAQTIDKMIRKIYEQSKIDDYVMFITSDHGNGEEDIELDGRKQLYHTVNNVPFICTAENYKFVPLKAGKAPYIGNVAATILKVLDMDIPLEMDPPIIKKKATIPTKTVEFDGKGIFMGYLLGILTVLVPMMYLRGNVFRKHRFPCQKLSDQSFL